VLAVSASRAALEIFAQRWIIFVFHFVYACHSQISVKVMVPLAGCTYPTTSPD